MLGHVAGDRLSRELLHWKPCGSEEPKQSAEVEHFADCSADLLGLGRRDCVSAAIRTEMRRISAGAANPVYLHVTAHGTPRERG
jgi:hypothetical protein